MSRLPIEPDFLERNRDGGSDEVNRPGGAETRFDHRLMLRIRCSAITSDAGLLPDRELVDGVGFGAAERWSLTSLRGKLIKDRRQIVSQGPATSPSRWPRALLVARFVYSAVPAEYPLDTNGADAT